MWANIALIAGAYLLGSAPHLLLLAKLRHVDLDGDFHQNLWYRGGWVTGLAGILGEFGKGIIPVLVGKALDFSLLVVALAGLAAVVGQMWPAFSKFDGEKGNSVAVPMALALTLIPSLIALVPVVISLLIRTIPRLLNSARSSSAEPVLGGAYSRSLPLGMMVSFLLLPLVSWWFAEPLGVILVYSALFVLMIVIRRITAGLKDDLRTSHNRRGVLINRLLYDRASIEWRQPTK